MNGGAAPRRHGVVVFALALVARLSVVAYGAGRFPPAADGEFYQRIAERVARGLGYTWLWPDGAVTYAAHYPIGYPGAVGLAYAAFGAHPIVAQMLNALLGAVAAVAAWALASRAAGPARGLIAGVAVAVHPGLVLYTPALMTEGVTAALLTAGAWAVAKARDRDGALAPVAVLGLVMGCATLVRPQSLAIAAPFGLLACAPRAPFAHRLRTAAIALGLTLAVCAPWTIRNCARMGRCAVVSVNGGWNLLIGVADGATGAWSPVVVPDECREVWGEADKDACFGDAALRRVADDPARFLALVPAKLAATFDYCGAAGWYLHEANPRTFDDRAKWRAGALETVYERLAWLAALATVGFVSGPRRRARIALAGLGAASLFVTHGFVAVVLFMAAAALLGRALLDLPVLFGSAFVVTFATAATHAVFFGAGRYGLVVFPLVTALGAARASPGSRGGGSKFARRES